MMEKLKLDAGLSVARLREAQFEQLIRLQREELRVVDESDMEGVNKLKLELFDAHESLVKARVEMMEFTEKISKLDMIKTTDQDGTPVQNNSFICLPM